MKAGRVFITGAVLVALALCLDAMSCGTSWAAPQKKAAAAGKPAKKKSKAAATAKKTAPAQKKPASAAKTATPKPKSVPSPGAAAAEKQKGSEMGMKMDDNFSSLPTFITSNQLSLDTEKRAFTYSGTVEVKHGDMVLKCDVLDGYYDEQNQIQRMVARSNVVILKGENTKATSQHAVYEKTSNTVTLTENPLLEQNGSELSADKITVELETNKSTAEGDVRVKLIGKEGETVGLPMELPKG